MGFLVWKLILFCVFIFILGKGVGSGVVEYLGIGSLYRKINFYYGVGRWIVGSCLF